MILLKKLASKRKKTHRFESMIFLHSINMAENEKRTVLSGLFSLHNINMGGKQKNAPL